MRKLLLSVIFKKDETMTILSLIIVAILYETVMLFQSILTYFVFCLLIGEIFFFKWYFLFLDYFHGHWNCRSQVTLFHLNSLSPTHLPEAKQSWSFGLWGTELLIFYSIIMSSNLNFFILHIQYNSSPIPSPPRSHTPTPPFFFFFFIP